jgi:CDP-glucose 4,6-dehydratase
MRISFLNTYKNKRVLVTGHTGFKGSWLCAWLKKMGAEVIGVALPPPKDKKSLFEAANIKEGMQSFFQDINDFPKVLEIFKQTQPEIIFHLAAQPLVRLSYQDTINTYMTNVVGTVNVLEAARFCSSIKTIVAVTTDKCYQNNEWVWGYRETDRLGGKDPYSASKACAELVISSYRESIYPLLEHSIQLASARGGNVIGGGDWSDDRLVPDIVNSLQESKTIVLRNPTATRPWQHVLELLYGYLVLGSKLSGENGKEFASAWNFGPAAESVIPVEALVRQFSELWGENTTIHVKPEVLPESHFLRLDASKAEVLLDWHPQLTIEESLGLTATWYKSYWKNSEKAQALVAEQINEYEKKINQFFS